MISVYAVSTILRCLSKQGTIQSKKERQFKSYMSYTKNQIIFINNQAPLSGAATWIKQRSQILYWA